MSIGPGKYDEACTQALEATGAQSVILIVIGGKEGHGFSCHSTDPDFETQIPMLLYRTAESIEEDLSKVKN